MAHPVLLKHAGLCSHATATLLHPLQISRSVPNITVPIHGLPEFALPVPLLNGKVSLFMRTCLSPPTLTQGLLPTTAISHCFVHTVILALTAFPMTVPFSKANYQGREHTFSSDSSRPDILDMVGFAKKHTTCWEVSMSSVSQGVCPSRRYHRFRRTLGLLS